MRNDTYQGQQRTLAQAWSGVLLGSEGRGIQGFSTPPRSPEQGLQVSANRCDDCGEEIFINEDGIACTDEGFGVEHECIDIPQDETTEEP